tara:strand:+ start:3769 stop:4032 length:264 start_codon:yes stop_codon:yes gene_type:complete
MKKITTEDIEFLFQSLRDKVESDLREQVKNDAIMVGYDLISTAHSMEVSGPETEEFLALQDFVYTLSDDYKIELYFQVKNGFFNWLS